MIISTRLGYIVVNIPKTKEITKYCNYRHNETKFLHNQHMVFDNVVLFTNNKKYILQIPLSPPFTHGKTQLYNKVEYNITRLTSECALTTIGTITTDFYSITVLSNKLEQFLSRAINQHILTGEIEVILPAREKDRINIAMYVYMLHSVNIQSV